MLSQYGKMIISSTDSKKDTAMINDITKYGLTTGSPDKSVTIVYKAVDKFFFPKY